MDSLEACQPYLRKALELVPDDPLGNYYLGSVLSQTNQPYESVRYLEQALRTAPNSVAYLSALAGVHESLKNFARSDSLYQRALELDPENALVLNNYGYSLSERDMKLHDALNMAKKALEKDPDNGAYLDTVGWIYFKLGDYQKALEYIEKAHAVRKSIEVTKHLGDVYEKLGMMEKAMSTWRKALEMDRHNPEILRRIRRNLEE
jgi:tetratricopeptide (TPR) repeat protein